MIARCVSSDAERAHEFLDGLAFHERSRDAGLGRSETEQALQNLRIGTVRRIQIREEHERDRLIIRV